MRDLDLAAVGHPGQERLEWPLVLHLPQLLDLHFPPPFFLAMWARRFSRRPLTSDARMIPQHTPARHVDLPEFGRANPPRSRVDILDSSGHNVGCSVFTTLPRPGPRGSRTPINVEGSSNLPDVRWPDKARCAADAAGGHRPEPPPLDPGRGAEPVRPEPAKVAVGARGKGAEARGPAESCIFILLSGGLSQIDTLDPKPQAPSEIRGPYRPIASAVPGVRVTEMMPRLATLADRYCLVRSMSHAETDHVTAARRC